MAQVRQGRKPEHLDKLLNDGQDGFYGLDCVPKKNSLKSQPLVPVNVTLFEKMVFADVIKVRVDRSWSLVLMQNPRVLSLFS